MHCAAAAAAASAENSRRLSFENANQKKND